MKAGSSSRLFRAAGTSIRLFFAGIVLPCLTLLSPLDVLADDLFCAHMVQHMLLLLVVPPLLVYGRPVIVWLWTFNLDARRAIARGWKRA